MNCAKQAVLVELVGLPGSGKTRLSSAIGDQLTAIGVSSITAGRQEAGGIIKNSINRLHPVWVYPVVSWHFYRYALAVGPSPLAGVRAAGAYLHEIASIKTATLRGDADCVVADEGLIHHCFSIAFGREISRSELILRRLFASYYGNTSCVLIMCQTPVDVCIARFRSRAAEKSSFSCETDDNRVHLFRQSAYRYQVLLSIMSRCIGNRLLIVDGLGDNQKASMKVAQQIADIIKVHS